MDELITAVITTYKRETAIVRRAVESVVNQTWRPLEIFVVNDCPEDTKLSAEIDDMIRKISFIHSDITIEYVLLEKNSGACVARNKGLELANGEYISFLDDDDVWEPEKLKKQREGFINENVGMVYSPFVNISFKTPDKPIKIVRGTKSGNLFEEMLCRNCIGGTSMPMMRTSALKSIGGFDVELLSSQDYDVWIRMAEKYEIQFVSDPLTKRFLLEESITTNVKKKQQGWEYVTSKYMKYYMTRKKTFTQRMNLMVSEMTSIGEKDFANKMMVKYRGYYGARVKMTHIFTLFKSFVKKIIRRV